MIAVIVHTRKSGPAGGGGVEGLRRAVERGLDGERVRWFDLTKSKQAPKRVRRALDAGASTILVWGGDGTVQRCVDALHQEKADDVALAVVPAGTANLFATNHALPTTVDDAVALVRNGERRRLDVGVLNGEAFAVMGGIGFDARMIRDADAGLKDKLGRLAYVWTGARNMGTSATKLRVRVDGDTWFDDAGSCVLVANVGTLMGGVEAFPDAHPADGVLEIGVVRATNRREWLRVFGRLAVGDASGSPLVEVTRGREIDVKLADKMPYELDGGDRRPTRRLRAHIAPRAVTVCVPAASPDRPAEP